MKIASIVFGGKCIVEETFAYWIEQMCICTCEKAESRSGADDARHIFAHFRPLKLHMEPAVGTVFWNRRQPASNFLAQISSANSHQQKNVSSPRPLLSGLTVSPRGGGVTGAGPEFLIPILQTFL